MRKWVVLVAVSLLLGSALLPAKGNHYVQNDAVWQVKCPFVGHNYHDAIVYPGQDGVSHRHDYFNIRVRFDTTFDQMFATPGTCTWGAKKSQGSEAADHASYWVPAIKDNGVLIDMTDADLDAYYFLGKHHPPVQPLPMGLKIVAGDAGATTPQSSQVVRMRCVDNAGGSGPNQQSIPDCRSGTLDTVVIVLLFPECWDGVNLDTVNPDGTPSTNPVTGTTYPNDHKSHMAYPVASVCPESHPVKVAKLSMTLRYLGPWRGGPGSSFVCGNAVCAHADFWNGWEPARQQFLVDECLNAIVNCRYLDI